MKMLIWSMCKGRPSQVILIGKSYRFANKHRQKLNIRVSKIEQNVISLSGGNQQKVALAKWLDFSPELMIFDEPARGIDIGAKTEIYSIMGELAAKGTAILMVY